MLYNISCGWIRLGSVYVMYTRHNSLIILYFLKESIFLKLCVVDLRTSFFGPRYAKKINYYNHITLYYPLLRVI